MHLTSLFPTVEKREWEKWGKNKTSPLFYFQIFSFFMPRFMENTGESGQRVNAFHLGGVHLQPWTTMALRILWGHGGVVSVLEMELARRPHSRQPHLQSPSLKESKQPAGAITWHISIQFPLQNVFIFRLMACHFAGAFGQELILESKQIFRGAIFHQVLIFLHSQSLYSLI